MFALSGCIVDSFDTSPSAQPTFSTSADGLDMGLFFANTPSPTSNLRILNRNSKLISLSEVRMRSGEYFRINVDGQTGRVFSDVDIRPNDSVYVFIECTLPEPTEAEPVEYADWLDVTTNGVTRSVRVSARSQRVNRLDGVWLGEDFTISAEVPTLVSDTLRVGPGVRLTVEPGARLLFHDGAALVVDGTLLCDGTPEAPIEFSGDRTNNVVADISYEVMSNQWEGVRFTSSSRGNRLAHTSVINTCRGVAVDSLADLTLLNSRLYNSGGRQLVAADSTTVVALGCEISNAASALVHLGAGNFVFDRCTIANWYLFKWPDEEIIVLAAPETMTADFANCIIYGRDTAISDYDNPEEVNVWFRRCLFSSKGSDDARYQSCLWETDPLLSYSLTEYTFSYLPAPDSPALGAANSDLDHPLLPAADRHGRPRLQTLGAYAPE